MLIKKEVECDGGVWDADSSMPLTLAGRRRGAVQNINVFYSGEDRDEPHFKCSEPCLAKSDKSGYNKLYKECQGFCNKALW